MKTKITYIVATWLGPRRADYYTEQYQSDPYFLIKQHITNLSIFDNDDINKIIIVVNKNDGLIDANLQTELNKLNCKIPYEIIIRENTGFSYAAWDAGIRYCLQNEINSDYYFLIEDDYVPIQDNFYRCFLNKFSDNVGGVFQLYTAMHGLKQHAAISNGMISRTVIETCLKKYENIFNIQFNNTYLTAQHNQETFLDHIEAESKIFDIADVANIPFYDINIGAIKYFGDITKPTPISPIYYLDLIQFTPITEHDAEFVNFIRNQYCDEYLHTSDKFTVDQTKSWIINTKPLYYIIWYGTVPIGYFRLSNFSAENKNIYIGADIHPEYTGLKLAVPSYTKFIDYLFSEYQLNKITLEVLETNTRAFNLYTKLGFIYEGQKRKEILKNNEYIDSIIMSILKEEWNRKNL